MSQEHKVAIVTGASRGIGRAIAEELGSLGYSLGLVAKSAHDLQTATTQIQDLYPSVSVECEAFDVSDENAVKRFVKRVGEQCGPVTVLVNNAGEYVLGTSTISADQLRRMIDVNLMAATFFVNAALPAMRAQAYGYIFNIASVCGVEAYGDVGGYCASKFGLVGYSHALDQELARYGIKATAICPSWVNTRMAARSPLSADAMIQPRDLAATVRYLLGLGASARVRELVINCDQ